LNVQLVLVRESQILYLHHWGYLTWLRESNTRFAPSCASRVAIASPIPMDAPVYKKSRSVSQLSNHILLITYHQSCLTFERKHRRCRQVSLWRMNRCEDDVIAERSPRFIRQ
jgi:hypothetical protein